MRTTKTTAVGFLICLICLFLMNYEIWANTHVIVVGFYGFPIGVFITVVGLLKKDDKDE